MYILEGNIGVGKSTFLKLIAELCPEVSVIQEPKEAWSGAAHGKSLLGNFYDNPSRWAYTMETLTMKSRVNDHLREQAHQDPNRIMERSVYSGHYCFAKNGAAQGFLSPLEWQLYSQWVDFLVKKQCKTPRGFVYLKAEPEVCLGRIHKRNRPGEEGIPLEYMQQINTLHDKFLLDKEDLFDELKSVPVLVIDCNIEFANNENLMNEHAARVRTFLRETQAD
jgi:deoxyguanosine kinase